MTCAELQGMPVRVLHARVQLALGAPEGVSALCSSIERSQDVRQAAPGRHCNATCSITTWLRCGEATQIRPAWRMPPAACWGCSSILRQSASMCRMNTWLYS